MEVLIVLYFLMVLMLAISLEVVLLAYVVVAYILEGKTLSAIARRRGIEKPGLAWVPVAKFWLLGAISDQYRYVVHGQLRNRRKLLLWLDIGLVAASTIMTTVVQVWAVSTIVSAATQGEEAFLATYMTGFMLLYLVMILYIGAAAVVSVFQYMAYYDLFRSCDPGKSLIYLLVSIFTSYPLPFFVYSCRDKDLGMPPRKDDIVDQREENEL